MGQRYKVKLQLCFDGSEFSGFQRQASSNKKTIQGELELALSQILDEPISVVGCGRTDAGVHATEYFIHFWTTKNPENYNFPNALNGPLTPSTIVTQKAWLAPDDFHALSSLKKTYKYLIYNGALPNPFKQRYSTYDRRARDVENLQKISQALQGTHDFSSFQTSGTDSKTTEKTLFEINWSEPAENHIQLTITADGFLRQMVRNMVGTLLWVDRNSHGPEMVEEILLARDRQAAKDTAPPQGLFLTSVEYPSELDNECRKI